MAEKDEMLWVDRLRLSGLVIDKEGQLIGEYANLIRLIKAGFIKQNKITSCEEFENCIRLIYEIYLFMKYNKIKEIADKKNTSKQLKEGIEKLHQLMAKHEKLDQTVGFDELNYIKEIIHQLISKAGYHHDKVKQGGSFEDEEW